MKNLHLICNAHLDPVWLWEWEEGAAEAISTFRTAADFCEEYDGFVFNHNEAVLYKWVEEYEPELFERIRRLVKVGKWHIMGGWYLQPDCNMPSGESFVRQILSGRRYFKQKFGVEPTTAINFDPFGHTRGLVQILKKSGYDSYLFCRPGQEDCQLLSDDFLWVGYDGSEVLAHRAYKSYLSARGDAHNKVKGWIEENIGKNEGLVLWGVGNHGGGPSRIDLENLKKLAEENKEFNILHSVPESYFEEIKGRQSDLYRHEKDLNPYDIGCYTSQIRVKQKHRLLENEIYMVEKMMSSASMQGFVNYPAKELEEALSDLMFSEFHDILPGSSIQPVETAALRLLDHGLEIVSRLKARAFFALAKGQKKAGEGQIPVLIFNPHPYKVSGIFECEFQLADQNWENTFSLPVLYRDGQRVPSQAEKESSNLSLDWRKRVVFAAELEPCCMNRFDAVIEVIPEKPVAELKEENNKISFKNDSLEVVINTSTGLIDRYVVDGVEYLKAGAFQPLVMEDNDDPWGMTVKSFRKLEGVFTLMDRAEGSEFSGVRSRLLESVRIIEDGAVRTVVEAVFKYQNSFICQRYKLPKQGTEMEIELTVYWNEKSRMLKLAVPTQFEDGTYLGQVAFGVEKLPNDGTELAAQKWTGIFSRDDRFSITCINDGTYGSDYKDGEMRISLIRSAGYSGHPILDRPIMAQDRFSPRIDQGERTFRFWINGGEAKDRRRAIEREALTHNEKPFALSFFPSGSGKKAGNLLTISGEVIQMTAFKKSESSGDFIIRLYNPLETMEEARISIPTLGLEHEVQMGKFEVKTLRLNPVSKNITETDLIEI